MEALGPELSFVIPCLNESATLAAVIVECHQGGSLISGGYEIIVADNGSSDGSQQIALANGAQLVNVHAKGYGAALAGGIAKAKGKYVLMGDADSTYDFRTAPLFVSKLDQGYDLVMGNRFIGNISKGAMPLLHQFLGNPVLSALGRLFFGITVGDFHCGLRAFNREAIISLNLLCPGMEFASEMVIKASLMDLSTSEIPTNLRPNPPGRIPHLNTWRDGWRHLKYMLSFAPKYSMLPIAALLLLIAIALIFAYLTHVDPFTGPNTLVFSVSCLIASVSIVSDYLLTREMVYSRYILRKSKNSFLFDRLLGLHRGTDRLFLIAGITFIIALLGFAGLLVFAWQGLLFLPTASMFSLIACTSILISITTYLTATKITSYRSLHQPLLDMTAKIR